MQSTIGRLTQMYMLAGACGTVLAAQTVPLELDFGGAKPPGVYPIRCGIPIPRGQAATVANLELLNAQGRTIPAQINKLAVWPDGSIKWALLSFLARAEEKLALRYGPDVSSRPPQGAIAAEGPNGWVLMTTGPLRVGVLRGGSGFIDELAYDANSDTQFQADEVLTQPGGEAQRSFLNFVHLNSPDSFLAKDYCLEGQPDPSRAVVESVEIEDPGPIHACVVVRGHYVFEKVGTTIEGTKTTRRCDFTLRLRAWAGLAMLFIQHTFVFDGDPDYDIVREVGLRLPLRLPADARVDSPDGASWRLPVAGLTVDGPDSHRVWGMREAQPTDFTLTRGGRTLTWLNAQSDRFGVVFGVRRGWQNHPKGLEVDILRGELTMDFWPPAAGPLDFRRYSREWGVGETGAGRQSIEKYARYAGKGVAKTHEALLCFHHGMSEAELAETVRAFDERPLIKAPAGYYAQSQALGLYHPYDPTQFPQPETVMLGIADYWLVSREKFRWYGFFDYGSLQQWFNTGPALTRWANDFGRWGWAGNDGAGRISWMYALQFLRTLDRRYFEMAESNATNIYDVWMVNTKEYPWDWGSFRDVSGCVHRHNVQPWGCPYIGARGACPTGAKIIYFLTADGRLKDALGVVLRMSEERLAGDTQRTGHSGGLGATDGAGTMAQAFFYAWETTGDDAYRRKALETIRSCNMSPKSGWEAVMTGAFGLYHAAADIYDLTGDPWCRDRMREFADVISQPELEKHWTYPNGYFRMFGDAARVFKEPKYREALDRALAALLRKAAGSAEMRLPRDQWPGRPMDPQPLTDANIGRDLPYALEALALTGGLAGEGGGG